MSDSFFNDVTFMTIEKNAFLSIQRIFPCEKDLLEKIPLDHIVEYFQKDIIPSSDPFMIRAVGQSGSGKSSQLVPALQYALQKTPYIKINVGMFAQFHPNYELWQQTDPDTVREKTNGFALKALVLFYKYCLLKHVNVLLDMTLLESEIDLYLMTLAKKMDYKIQMHMLCVPKRISDLFIKLRQKETGRYVSSASSLYFFNALAPSLKSLVHSKLFNKQDRLILWTHYLTYPVYKTHLNNPFALRVLGKYRRNFLRIKEPKTLLKAKKRWMKLFVELLDV